MSTIGYFHITVVILYVISPFVLFTVCLLSYNILNTFDEISVTPTLREAELVMDGPEAASYKLIENFLKTYLIHDAAGAVDEITTDITSSMIDIADLKDDICLEEYKLNQKVTFMCCEKRTSTFTTDNPSSREHKFHTECLKKHIMVNYTGTKQYIYKCPLCRTPIII